MQLLLAQEAHLAVVVVTRAVTELTLFFHPLHQLVAVVVVLILWQVVQVQTAVQVAVDPLMAQSHQVRLVQVQLIKVLQVGLVLMQMLAAAAAVLVLLVLLVLLGQAVME
jgi:hypothetical protein